MTDSNGNTALIAAAMNGHDAVVRLLLSSGADKNAANKSGETVRRNTMMVPSSLFAFRLCIALQLSDIRRVLRRLSVLVSTLILGTSPGSGLLVMQSMIYSPFF